MLTDSTALQQALRLVDLVPLQCALIDGTGQLVHANPSWRRYVGLTTTFGLTSTDRLALSELLGLDPGSPDAEHIEHAVAETRTAGRGQRTIDYVDGRRGGRFRLQCSRLAELDPSFVLLTRLELPQAGLSEGPLQRALELTGQLVFALDEQGRFVYASGALAETLGMRRSLLLGRFLWDADPQFSPDLWGRLWQELTELGQLEFQTSSLPTAPDEEGLEIHAELVGDGDSRVAVAVARQRPVDPADTGQWFAMAAEGVGRSAFSSTVEPILRAGNLGLWEWIPASGEMHFDAHWHALLGYPPGELDPKIDTWLSRIHDEDVDAVRMALDDHLAGLSATFQRAHRLRSRNGDYRWVLARGKVTERDAEGRALRFSGSLVDLTEHRQLEEHRQQSQKMKALGRMAGGVAHDFNNLLTVINGYSDLALAALGPEDRVRRMVEEIRRVGGRAAALTDRLLSFSRKRLLRPQLLDINEAVGQSLSLLEPALGEGIEIQLHTAEDLPLVEVDRVQLEQMLLNLAINARDAMSGQGTLRISTAVASDQAIERVTGSELVTGDFVQVTVADGGHGIDETMRERVFEPFFTTKELGHGTGLGLSMVYGAVTQSGGFVELDSTPDVGTEVRLYLPGQWRSSDVEVEPSKKAPARGDESLLLVEDQDALRRLVEKSLRDQGYEVQSAEDAAGARALVAGGFRPDLLITDVVLPGTSGLDLAAELLRELPELEVLYVSGDVDDSHEGLSKIANARNFLPKPFELQQLSSRARSLLDDR